MGIRRRCGLGGATALFLAMTAAGPLAAAEPGAAQPRREATCHGEAATLVGEPGSDLYGTPGSDVVVTNGAPAVFTDAGDDLICVTGDHPSGYVLVVASDGNDLIDATVNETRVANVILGAGDDQYIGGPYEDMVTANDPWSMPPGQGADTISTAGGDDSVTTGGSPTNPDHDSIDLGAGRDDLWMQGFVDPALPMTGGPGSDVLEFDRRTLLHSLVIDNAAGQATTTGIPTATWSGMERFMLVPIGGWEAPSFVGGPGPERVWSAVPLTSVDLGGGDDLLNLELQDELVDHASYSGGEGNDSFILYADAGDQARRARLNLPEGRLFFLRDSSQPGVHARIDGFERHRLSATRLVVIGSPGDDRIEWAGCRGIVEGGPGADLIQAHLADDVGCGYDGEFALLVVRGGGGDDTLIGGYMPDTLLGGPGDDVANGRENLDRCTAETELHCEH